MSTYYDERVQQRPSDKKKIQELHNKYNEIKASGIGPKHRPWTRDLCLTLGVLYFESWGFVPSSRHMDSMYSMPHRNQIKRVFGSIEEFYESILQVVQVSAQSS